jgi:hypothetical protein
MRKARVGISIAIEADSSIWNSGLNQNLLLLAQLLAASPVVGQVVLLNVGAADRLPPDAMVPGLDFPVARPQDLTHELDLVIEFGASLPLEWVRHVKALGTRVVAFLVGHTYGDQAHNPIFGRSGGTIFVGTPWDEVWTLPHHMKTSAPLLRTVTRVPVVAMPHIWSPAFLQPQIDSAMASSQPFGFKPQPGKAWRIGIFEPNISVVKNCFIPMLACESAFRERSDAIELMMVMNTFHMKEHATFNAFASHLDLTRAHKASYEPRLAFVEGMAQHRIDAVVSHQWECGLNYVYYDALYGGYPLVHNSPYLQEAGVGLHYQDFGAIEGGHVLLQAWAREAGWWDDYRSHAASYLATLDPRNPVNVKAYSDQIARLLGDRLGDI